MWKKSRHNDPKSEEIVRGSLVGEAKNLHQLTRATRAGLPPLTLGYLLPMGLLPSTIVIMALLTLKERAMAPTAAVLLPIALDLLQDSADKGALKIMTVVAMDPEVHLKCGSSSKMEWTDPQWVSLPIFKIADRSFYFKRILNWY